jgi:hypothetical protein
MQDIDAREGALPLPHSITGATSEEVLKTKPQQGRPGDWDSNSWIENVFHGESESQTRFITQAIAVSIVPP